MYVVVNGSGGEGGVYVGDGADNYEIVGKYAPVRVQDEPSGATTSTSTTPTSTKQAKTGQSDDDSGSDSDDGESDEDDYMDEDSGERGLPAQAKMGRVGGEFWAKYYWNEKFQTVLERPTTTPEEAKQRSSDIHGLARLYDPCDSTLHTLPPCRELLAKRSG
jgi:hypothetical protein